ncbi:MAG: PilZ domain-containing protein [Candidatus Aminicenantes bacterium]|nr:MAG: PilZ domain-containing protein [Candidatus Aminicenantes bacterium]
MTKKTAAKKAPSKKKTKKEIADLKFNRRREWRFDLPLPAEVEGKLPQGKKFKETITLNNISCQGAYFCLDSGVVVGSKLNLAIDIPDELSGSKNLKLLLGGLTIRLEEPDKREKKQGLAIRFNKKFRIITDKKKK